MEQIRTSVITCFAVHLLLLLPLANAVGNPFHPFHNGYLNAKRRSDIKTANIAKTEADSNETKTAEVIVVGAGIAGLTAASYLQKGGVSVVVVEARNRTGGRLWSVPIPGVGILDFGGAWIQGLRASQNGQSAENPLYTIAKQLNLTLACNLYCPDTPEDERAIAISENGEIVDFDFEAANNAVAEWQQNVVDKQNKLHEVGNAINVDVPLEGVYQYTILNSTVNTLVGQGAANLTQQELVKQAVATDVYAVEDEQGGNAIDLSTSIIHTGSDFYGEQTFFVKGYNQITDYLAQGLDIRLQQVVSKIEYDASNGVTVTAGDETYTADRVIVAVPLGTIRSQLIEFSPPLPSWYAQAINNIGVGYYEKTVLIFDEPWWQEKANAFFIQRVVSDTKRRGFLADWVNVYKTEGIPALVCLTPGSWAKELAALSDEELYSTAMDVLRGMFGDAVQPYKLAFRTKWSQDPYAGYMSYSFEHVKQGPWDFYSAGQPVDGVLQFAGEHTARDYYGYAHGAYFTGRREAKRILCESQDTGTTEGCAAL